MNKLFQETQSNNMANRIQQIIQQFNIPQQMQNDPHQIVNYLVQSGKINQDAVNRAMQTAQQMGIKL
jgi:polyhydroxyalkanoate synthesis regulator phasin